MSALVTVKGMPRSFTQPSWTGTLLGSRAGGAAVVRPPMLGFRAVTPLMPAGSGAIMPAMGYKFPL